MRIEELSPNKRSRTDEPEKTVEHVYQGLHELEQKIFDEAWDSITTTKEFIDSVNAKIKEIGERYQLQIIAKHESE